MSKANIRLGRKGYTQYKRSSLFSFFVSDEEKDVTLLFEAFLLYHPKKVYITLTPGPNIIKLFMSVIYEFS